MKKKILDVKDTRLRKPSKKVKRIDKKVKRLIKDLKDTLKAQKDPEGVGLAAPQIGKNFQIFAIRPKDKIKIFINPKILSISKIDKKQKSQSAKIMEGCLSLPHFYSPLKRADKVRVSFEDEKGNKKTRTFEGIEAQIIQHEIDHLKGKLFVDRILEQKKPLYEHVNGEWEEVELV